MNNLEKLYLSKIAGKLGVDFDDFGRPIKRGPPPAIPRNPFALSSIPPPAPVALPKNTTQYNTIQEMFKATGLKGGDLLNKWTAQDQRNRARAVRVDPRSNTTTRTLPGGVVSQRSTGFIPPGGASSPARTPVVAPRTPVVAPRTPPVATPSAPVRTPTPPVVAPRASSGADFLRQQTIAAQKAKANQIRSNPASKTTTTTGPKGTTTRTTGYLPGQPIK